MPEKEMAVLERGAETSTTVRNNSSSGLKRGTVKWFCMGKGVGTIRLEGFESDIFVQFSGIKCLKQRKMGLREGDPVEFRLAYTGNGPEARDILKLKI